MFAAPEPAPPPARPVPPRAAEPPPTPAPAPAPAPAAPPAPAPSSTGIVSSRLRPSLEIGLQPLRCIVTDDQVTVEFDLELFNFGSAPARGVLVEAVLFNAGPVQEQEIGAFFEKPVGAGERIEVLPPLKRLNFTTQVSAPRTQIQVLEVGGRQVFVPLLGFNALYSWGSSEGQTSAAYLLGREGQGEKLAPFRLDLGPRVFRGLGARALPQELRR